MIGNANFLSCKKRRCAPIGFAPPFSYFRYIYQTKNLSASTAAAFYIPLSGKQGLKEICDCLKRTDKEITDRR